MSHAQVTDPTHSVLHALGAQRLTEQSVSDAQDAQRLTDSMRLTASHRPNLDAERLTGPTRRGVCAEESKPGPTLGVCREESRPTLGVCGHVSTSLEVHSGSQSGAALGEPTRQVLHSWSRALQQSGREHLATPLAGRDHNAALDLTRPLFMAQAGHDPHKALAPHKVGVGLESLPLAPRHHHHHHHQQQQHAYISSSSSSSSPCIDPCPCLRLYHRTYFPEICRATVRFLVLLSM